MWQSEMLIACLSNALITKEHTHFVVFVGVELVLSVLGPLRARTQWQLGECG